MIKQEKLTKQGLKRVCSEIQAGNEENGECGVHVPNELFRMMEFRSRLYYRGDHSKII